MSPWPPARRGRDMSAATSMRVGGDDGDAAATREEAMGAAYPYAV